MSPKKKLRIETKSLVDGFEDVFDTRVQNSSPKILRKMCLTSFFSDELHLPS